MSKQKTMKGFTLIEILVVVALIAILTAITFIAINPAKNFADTRNAQRSSDVAEILSAVTQYTTTAGHTLATLSVDIPVCTTASNYGATQIGTGTDLVNLSALAPDYIVGIPVDPSGGTDAATGYSICTTSAEAGRIRITSMTPEVSKLISVLR